MVLEGSKVVVVRKREERRLWKGKKTLTLTS
jgi:hypothetical protein